MASSTPLFPESGMPDVRLRAARPDDEEFLYSLYASTREGEFQFLDDADEGLGETLLRMQFEAQRQGYSAEHPEAEHWIVCEGSQEQPIGRILLERGEHAFHLVDISLVPDHRGRGIGSRLIGMIQNDAARRGLPIRLRVLKTNPARNLYLRLRFRGIGESGPHWWMEWRPT